MGDETLPGEAEQRQQRSVSSARTSGTQPSPMKAHTKDGAVSTAVGILGQVNPHSAS